MTASLFDSAPYRALLGDRDIATLFSDTAIVRAQLLTLGTLALTQAISGTVPETSAQAIQRAAMEVQVDPASLSAGAEGQVVSLIRVFAAEMKAPENAKWIGIDTDPADIADTAFALRLRQVLNIFETRLTALPDASTLAGLETLRQSTLLARHGDDDTRKGLAAGLGLRINTEFRPRDSIVALSRWLVQTISALPATDPIITTMAAHLRVLQVAAMQRGDDTTTRLLADLSVPQMCLCLGVALQRAQTGLAK